MYKTRNNSHIGAVINKNYCSKKQLVPRLMVTEKLWLEFSVRMLYLFIP